MAELKPKPLPCPKCGKTVHVSLTGWGLQNWLVLKPECKCFPQTQSKHYWIDNDGWVSEAESAYRELTEAWNRRAVTESPC